MLRKHNRAEKYADNQGIENVNSKTKTTNWSHDPIVDSGSHIDEALLETIRESLDFIPALLIDSLNVAFC